MMSGKDLADALQRESLERAAELVRNNQPSRRSHTLVIRRKDEDIQVAKVTPGAVFYGLIKCTINVASAYIMLSFAWNVIPLLLTGIVLLFLIHPILTAVGTVVVFFSIGLAYERLRNPRNQQPQLEEGRENRFL